MSVSVACPHCGASLKSASAPAAGKGITCPKCGKRFRYDPAAAAPTPAQAPPEPRRGSGGKIAALLIAVLLLGGAAVGTWRFGLLPKQITALLPGPKAVAEENDANRDAAAAEDGGGADAARADADPADGDVIPAGADDAAAGRPAPQRAASLQDLVKDLPAAALPNPDPDDLDGRDAANAWLAEHSAGRLVEFDLMVAEVQANQTEPGRFNVTYGILDDGPPGDTHGSEDPIAHGTVTVGGKPWPAFVRLPSLPDVDTVTAERMLTFRGRRALFRGTTRWAEFSESAFFASFDDLTPVRAAEPPPGETPADEARPTFASTGRENVLGRPDADAILDVAWSPDGRFVAAFDSRGEASLWDVAEKRGYDVSPKNQGPREAGERNGYPTTHLRFSADGKTLVIGTSYKAAVFDLPERTLRWEAGEAFETGPLIVDAELERIALFEPSESESELKIVVRDIKTGKPVFTGPSDSTTTPIALSPGGKLLALADGTEQKYRLLDGTTGKEAGFFSATMFGNDIGFSADGRNLLLRHHAEEGQSWDVSNPARPKFTGRVPQEDEFYVRRRLVEASKGQLLYGRLSRDARSFVGWGGVGAGAVKVLDVATGATRTVVPAAAPGETPSAISAVALSDDGGRVAIGTQEGTVVVRDLDNVSRSVEALANLRFAWPDELKRHAGAYAGKAPGRAWFSPDGQWLVTGGKVTTLWDLAAKAQHMVLAAGDGRGTFANLPPKTPVPFVDSFSGSLPADVGGGGFFQKDGRTFTVAASREAWLLHYDVRDRTHRGDFNAPFCPGLRASPDGRVAAAWLVTRPGGRAPNQEQLRIDFRAELVILNAADGTVKKSLGNIRSPDGISATWHEWRKRAGFFKFAFSPDGRILAAEVPSENGSPTIRISNWETGEEIPTSAVPNPDQGLHFAESARWLMTTFDAAVFSEQQVATVYDVETGARSHELVLSRGHAGEATAWAFAPTEPVFATGDGEGTLLFRDLADGKERTRVKAHDAKITAIGFSPDGARLATCAADDTVKVWDVSAISKPPAKPPERAVATAAPRPPQPTPQPPATPSQPSPRPTSRPSSQPSQQPPANDRPAPQPAGGARSETDGKGKGERPGSGPKVETNSVGMKLVVLPPGSFTMGAADADPGAEPNERPARAVRITKPFALGLHEVTVGQFRAFVEATGHTTEAEADGAGGTGYDAGAAAYVEERQPGFTWRETGWEQSDDHPVVNVTWNDAAAFCAWLSGKEGKRYRLPTEAEWEYACRAGTKTRFWRGDEGDSLREAENIGDASLRTQWGGATWAPAWDDGQPFTAPVGRLRPNAWGLFDLHGNVAEWTADWYDPSYYEGGSDADPRGPASGAARVVRGGSWYNEPRHARASFRWGESDPSSRDAAIGFRVAREP